MNIAVDSDVLRATFSAFDLEEYRLFLRTKKLPESRLVYDEATDCYTLEAPARFAHILGVANDGGTRDMLPMPEAMFDYQAILVRNAILAKRFAIWADCGFGKSLMQLEWARQVMHLTRGRVLILAPIQVIPQTVEEAKRWYGDTLPVTVLKSREAMADWCKGGHGLAICNYEKLIAGIMNEMRQLAGLVCDESSLLRSGGGVIKWHLIKSARGIEYKLSCTATPAPNEVMEYASQAAFLEKLRSEGEILWTYFCRDKAGVWRVKPHARDAFYRFMAGWSIYLRSPASYGWYDNLKDVPAQTYHVTPIEPTPAQLAMAQRMRAYSRGMLFDDGSNLGVVARAKLSQLAKGFIYAKKDGKQTTKRVKSAKPQYVADIVQREVAAGRQTLVWTLYDAESDIIRGLLPEGFQVEVLSGKVPKAKRLDVLERFRNGQTQCLISKAQLVGYGMNFQFCRAMVFSGFDDSFERLYQAIRRAYRYGQTESLQVHIPYVPDLEGEVWANVQRKQRQFEADAAECERCYLNAMMEVKGAA